MRQKNITFEVRLTALHSKSESFWTLVHKTEKCWVWTGGRMPNDYGRYSLYASGAGELAWVAHRAAWELLRGEIPSGLTLDHLCRNRGCVNPDHLEPVTNAENIRRGALAITHCPKGHEYTPENTNLNSGRHCKRCNLDRIKLRRGPRTRIPFGPCKVCGVRDEKGGLGYCGYHYYRFKTYGDPLAPTRFRRKASRD